MRTPRYRFVAPLAVLGALWLLLDGTGVLQRQTESPVQSPVGTPEPSPNSVLPRPEWDVSTVPATPGVREGTSNLESLRARFYRLADPAAERNQPPYADFCAGLNADNVDLYLELLASITESGLVTERARLQSAILLRWATFDRPSALQMAVGLPSRDRNLSLNQLIRAWAQTDRAAAWNYVRATSAAHAGDENLNLYGPFLAERSQEDPTWALDRLRELPAGPATDLAAQNFFSAQAAVDLDRARVWLDALPNDSMRDRALYALTMHAAPTDPPQALESLRSLSLPAPELERSASRITRIWAAESPALATDWLARQNDNPLFPVIARTLAQQLTTRDVAAARAWLTPHALDPRYLPALFAHVEAMGTADAADAQRWAEALPAGPNRSAVLTHLSQRGD